MIEGKYIKLDTIETKDPKKALKDYKFLYGKCKLEPI